jgi:hypothetical protein
MVSQLATVRFPWELFEPSQSDLLHPFSELTLIACPVLPQLLGLAGVTRCPRRPGVGHVPQIIGKSADYANRARTASRDSIVTQYRTRFAGTTLRRIANMQITAFLVTWCDALNALCSFPPTGRLTVTQGFCPWEACLWACITEGSHSMRSGGHVGSDQGAVPASRQVRFPIDDVADVPPRVHIECRVDRPGCAGCGVTVHVNDRPVVVLVDSPCLARPTHPVWHSGLPSGSRDSGTTGFGHCSAPEIPTGTCSPHL